MQIRHNLSVLSIGAEFIFPSSIKKKMGYRRSLDRNSYLFFSNLPARSLSNALSHSCLVSGGRGEGEMKTYKGGGVEKLLSF
mgnify:CR=1 FL=1